MKFCREILNLFKTGKMYMKIYTEA